jgi:hypothetical protein
MAIGFLRPQTELRRRPVYGPGSGRKLGYYATDGKGNQFAQNLEGRTVMRILRWKNGTSPYTDSHACGGSFVPREF